MVSFLITLISCNAGCDRDLRRRKCRARQCTQHSPARQAAVTNKQHFFPARDLIPRPYCLWGFKKKIAFVITLSALSCSSSAFAQQVTASVGVDLSQGDFGSDIDPSILVIPAALRATFSKFSVSVAVPYIAIDGATNILGGGEGPIITDPTAGVARRSGLGDVNVRASFNAFDFGNAAVTLHGRAKLQTGSRAQNLSTGELDYSGGVEIVAIKGSVQPFVEVGYRVLGSPLTTYGTVGLSESAANWGSGIMLSLTLGR